MATVSMVLTHTSHGVSTKLTVMGGKQSSHVSGLPQMPPPLVHCPTALISPPSRSFELAFVAGNISVCRGCRQKYTKPALPPMDFCVRHKEWQQLLIHVAISQTALVTCIIIVTFHVFNLAVQSLNLISWKYLLESQYNFYQYTQYLIKQMPGRFM